MVHLQLYGRADIDSKVTNRHHNVQSPHRKTAPQCTVVALSPLRIIICNPILIKLKKVLNSDIEEIRIQCVRLS